MPDGTFFIAESPFSGLDFKLLKEWEIQLSSNGFKILRPAKKTTR